MAATALLVVATCAYLQTTPVCTPIDSLPRSDMVDCGQVAALFTKYTPSGVFAYCMPLVAAPSKIEKPK